MFSAGKLVVACVVAVVVFSIAVGSASAGRLRVRSTLQKTIWQGLRVAAGGTTIRCNLTLEESFHSATFRKVIGALLGHVTRASVGSCSGGSATVLTETLPWSRRYSGFEGRLPNIEELPLVYIGMSIVGQATGSLKCVIRSSEANPARAVAHLTGGVVSEVNADETAEIPLTGEGGLCNFAGSAHLAGVGTATGGSGESIEVVLI